ncbi:hypothetical protein SUGI_0465110 [Cryptomeria japonica]|nr:hypothetical protein SUGI_0465110 [Cryptomeria japonica]
MEQLRCSTCETDVNAYGECNCDYSIEFDNEEVEVMEMYKNNFIEVIKCCIRLRVPNTSQINRRNLPFHLDEQGRIIKEMCFYPNGVHIYCNCWFDGYPITDSNSIENERSRDETNINHQNSSRQPYTLPVRVLLLGTEVVWDTIIEIVSHEVNWQQILEDLELNRVRLGWLFFDLQSGVYSYFDYEEHIEGFQNSFEDVGFRGAPPAGRSAVENLERETIEENRDFLCCICQAILLAGEKCLKMPCNHEYHEGCILQWLANSNFCPACKYELPTDDPDYEAQKQRRNR